MAASVLLLVGKEGATAEDSVLAQVVAKASALKAGTQGGQVGALISDASKAKVLGYISRAIAEDGATVLVDGRPWAEGVGAPAEGNWIGPTILVHKSASDAAVREEIFGPVLSVVRCATREDAIAIENSNPFGNGACIYTSSGAQANWFISRFRAGMLGVNIGIPVPREPFAFGGLYGTLSKYGDMDLTGEGAIEFFSNRVKLTCRWPSTDDSPRKGAAAAEPKDKASFNGKI